VISELDIWRAAALLVKLFGVYAELGAARHADRMIARGDDAGRAVWLRIRRAIEALQAPRRGEVN
jgi:hypothetical protein